MDLTFAMALTMKKIVLLGVICLITQIELPAFQGF